MVEKDAEIKRLIQERNELQNYKRDILLKNDEIESLKATLSSQGLQIKAHPDSQRLKQAIASLNELQGQYVKETQARASDNREIKLKTEEISNLQNQLRELAKQQSQGEADLRRECEQRIEEVKIKYRKVEDEKVSLVLKRTEQRQIRN